jgi:hypothetical protein
MPIIPPCLTNQAIDIQAIKSQVRAASLRQKISVERAAVSSLKIIFRNEEEVLDKEDMLR